MRLSWLPNAISIFRIALDCADCAAGGERRFTDALILFFVAGLSDGLDGFLAKRFNWHTRPGRLLDPIADKLLIAGTYAPWHDRADPGLARRHRGCRDVVIIGGATHTIS